jgi:nucleoside-diphosphate-sugar epimerase
MMDLAAVTGASGFLGRYIVRALSEDGRRVRALVRRYPVHDQLSDSKFEAVPGDLSNLSSLHRLVRGAHSIVHAGGLIKARDSRDFYRVNVEGTANLVDAVNASDTPMRLVLVSSMAARAPHLSPYAATKNAAEEIVRTRLLPLHEWIIIRPAAVYGPWDRETLAVLKAVSLGVALRPGGRQGRVCLVHARDVAAAVAMLSARGQPGHEYEICDSRFDGYLWEEITDAAARVLDIRTMPIALPAWAMRCAGGVGSVLSQLTMSPSMLTIHKVRELLHPDWSSTRDSQPPGWLWQPQIDLNCGFLETIAWYQTRGWLSSPRKVNSPD